MERLQYSIAINAPQQKVWGTMLNDKTYREWTSIFNSAGSCYEGEWKTGAPMRFLGPNKDGTVSGMFSKIKEVRPYDFVSIAHLGEIVKGKDVPWQYEGMEGAEPEENYTLIEKNGVTEVVVELDSNEQFKKMFEDTWPKALERLKELAEK